MPTCLFFFFHVKIKSGQQILLEGVVGLWHGMPSLVFGKNIQQYVEQEGAWFSGIY